MLLLIPACILNLTTGLLSGSRDRPHWQKRFMVSPILPIILP